MATITFNRNGATRTIPVGFSWTTLVFGWLPSLFRGHWYLFWTIVGCDLASVGISIVVFEGRDLLATFIAARWFLAAIRNTELRKFLARDGWKLAYNGVVKVPASAIGKSANDWIDK